MCMFVVTWQHDDVWRIVCDCAGNCMDLFVSQGSGRRQGAQTGKRFKRDYFQRRELKKLTRDGAALWLKRDWEGVEQET